MSRERPAEPPRAVPDAERGMRHETQRQRAAREDLERLKASHGAGVFGRFVGSFQERIPNLRFIRRGYEASIIDELTDFFSARPRPWRPGRNTPKQPELERRRIARRAR